MRKSILLTTLAFLAFGSAGYAAKWYVKQNASGSANGSDWSNAFTDLQAALSVATYGDTVFVASGTYKPSVAADGSSPNSRDRAFVIPGGIHIFGGFTGTESNLAERNRDSATLHGTNATILSGDIGAIGDSTDNTYHVVIAADVSNFTLDGFTIMNGNANGTGTLTVRTLPIERRGGGAIYNDEADGMYRNLVIKNNTAYSDNDEFGGGGGVYNNQGTPQFNNCTFLSNRAVNCNGGAMKNFASSPRIVNCSFRHNSAITQDEGGGAINNKSQSTAVITNTIFDSNESTLSGGAMYDDESFSSFENVSFINNRAANCGGGLDAENSSKATLTNVKFVGNEAGEDGGGLYSWRGDATLLNVEFINNSAGINGGGMYNYNTCNPVMTNVIFNGNTAGGSYGGFGIERNSVAVITNGLFARNVAAVNGGGLGAHDNHGTNATIISTNITVVNNRAGNAGGAYDRGTTSQSRNSLYAGNYPDDVDVNPILATTSRTTIFGGDTGLILIVDGSINPFGTAVNWPVFVDTGASNYLLISNSPAIDAGTNLYYNAGQTPDLSGITTDLRGANRSMGLSVDIGAYEHCNITVTPSVTIQTSAPNNSIEWHEPVTFTAVPVNGGSNPSYQWLKNGNPIPGATNNTWVATSWDDFKSEDAISVIMTSSEPCADPTEITSDEIHVLVHPESVAGIEGAQNGFTLYPNPTNGNFAIKGLQSGTPYEIIISDVSGRKIYQTIINGTNAEQSSSITLPDAGPGLYIMSVNTGAQRVATLKLMVQ